MNTIPSVGPEPSIAPRTGSGSPQTTPQQRADVAPVVISDSSTARADPGVMLKITPPVGARQGDVAVPQHALPGEVAKTLADLEAERAGEIRALLGSAADADEAVSARLNQAFAALPADVQEAIRQATTPGMAQLLRLASLTASGIREAPARLDTGGQPLAPDAQQAAKALLDAIHASPPFQLANLLRVIAQGRLDLNGSASAGVSSHSLDGISNQSSRANPATQAEASRAGTATSQGARSGPGASMGLPMLLMGTHQGAGPTAPGTSSHPGATGVDANARVAATPLSENGSTVDINRGLDNLSVVGSLGDRGASGESGGGAGKSVNHAGQPSELPLALAQTDSEGLPVDHAMKPSDAGQRAPVADGGSKGLNQPAGSPVPPSTSQGSAPSSVPNLQNFAQATQQHSAGNATSGSQQFQGQLSAGGSLGPTQGLPSMGGSLEPALGQSSGNIALAAGVMVSTPALMAVDQAEAGLRDALRLLMDGRMIWQGQFTEGVPMALERADAWRANRRGTGGMEKGTSLRLRLQLPHLGEVEVRALGFGGQVAVRVHAPAESTGDMVNALPKLQATLRERGLAGAQIVVETL